MTDIAIASTGLRDREAGEHLAAQLLDDLSNARLDAIIVFASAENDYESLLPPLDQHVGARTMVGCSSAGEFTSGGSGTGRTTAVAFRAPDMRFSASLARGLSESRRRAARQLAEEFHGLDSSEHRYRTALVFVDALAGHAEALVDQLTLATGGTYQFVGGGAGDDGRFNSYGQIARAEGQFSGFHNCTAVVCVFPD